MVANKTKGTALALALFAIFVWGASFAVTRAAVREIPPLALAFLRFALAAAVLWPAARRFPLRVARADRLAVFSLGFVGVTLYFAFENAGLARTTASHGALLVAIIPLITELLAARRRRRPPSRRIIFCLLTALAGMAVIFGQDEGAGASAAGDLLMLGAVAAWIGYTLLAEDLTRRYPGLPLTMRIMAVGAATLLPLALIEAAFLPFGRPSVASWSGVAFLGVFCSALAYLAWNRAIPALGVTRTNALINLIPLFGVLAGVLGLGEPLSLRIVFGGGLILAGVAGTISTRDNYGKT
ncbi:MAG: DMT family transporter [Desulfuromonadales bacterium]